MIVGLRSPLLHWTGALPVLAVVLLALTWGPSLPVPLIVLVSCFPAGRCRPRCITWRTIPAVALATVWLPVPLVLGLGAGHVVLLALTVIVGTLTVLPGRATPLQGGVHLALLAAYIVLAASP
ncbi:hypothetical protein ADK74_09385 [Streptomyces decoyicus]|nr:hypothetical protein ADK74_09385 [Streptomyces decoyicus]